MGAQPAGDDRAKGKGNLKTWRECAARGAPGAPGSTIEPELLTRYELLATVERWGVTPPVNERTLRYWEDVGVLPRATIEGEPGRQRALYPWWVADLIAQVRQFQDRGLDLPQLRERMPTEALRLSRVTSGRWMAARPAVRQAQGIRDFPPEIVHQLVDALGKIAATHHYHDGVRIAAVELHLHATNGEEIVHTLPLDYREAIADKEFLRNVERAFLLDHGPPEEESRG